MSFQCVDLAGGIESTLTMLAPKLAGIEVRREYGDDVPEVEVYAGEGIPDGKKSLNFTVTLGSMERTLTSKDEEKYLNKVRAEAVERSQRTWQDRQGK